MRKKSIIAGCAIISVLAVILSVKCLLRFLPPGYPTDGFVSVVHSGYTNDAAGNRLAVFVVTNQGDVPYARMDKYWLQTRFLGPREGKTISSGTFSTGQQTIQPGQSENLYVPAPLVNSPWRVYMFAKKNESVSVSWIRSTVVITADSLGKQEFADEFRNLVCGVQGHWIDPLKK